MRTVSDDTITDVDARVGMVFQEVLRRSHLSAPEELGRVFAEEARRIGVDSLVVYVVDYAQRTLVPVPSPDASGSGPLSIQGTIAGRAFASTAILDVEGDAGECRRLWIPLLDGTERIGVLRLSFASSDRVPGALLAACERYAHFIALLVVTKSAYTDFFELLRRTAPMTLASELIWELVPPLVLASEDFVLSALLEPCYDIGGDAFDYALDEGVLHVAVFDAMGHGLPAAGMASLAISAYRHSRRNGDGPAAAYTAIDAALADQHLASRFVTALIAQLDLSTGQLLWVSAGHPAPLLLRDGRLVKTLDLAPAPPLALQLASGRPLEGREALEPGDMLVLYTDGLTEARRPGGELFTVERLGEFIERGAASGRSAPETLRQLREAIIERGAGALNDDATAVLVEWRRGSGPAMLPQSV
jgi:serine/threonine protein phosphatase PrpC